MQALIDFISNNNVVINKTKSKKGFMIYQPSQVSDLNTLTTLAGGVGWKVIQSEEEWDKGKLVRPAQIYVGPVTNSFELTDPAAALSYLQSQMS
jgi:hypothetical protein